MFPPPAPSSSKQPESLVCDDEVDNEDETLGVVLSLLSCVSLNPSNAMLLMSAVLDSAQGNPVPLAPAAANMSTAIASTSSSTTVASNTSSTTVAPTPFATTVLLAVSSHGPHVPVALAAIGALASSTRTHNGQAYNVPEGPVTGAVYLVTRGRRIGIFSSWQLTSPHVTGVSHAVFSRWPSIEAGITAMEDVIDADTTQILP
ncbi:hypothetical protein SERLA73DRAFT_71551 [Serpula lacrymans var. lacrymans S7.3]|uniref:Ribonuclease H1 N-terminal domain-containing protein n=2 Tax=Serpula lacrymans var. lacrymans TaxID=341189 RepID=F8PTK3_SERL3|nr:uncharacterized protein SERLADRAFT_435936 [Serpula lacrymans var. lacrymans S7.9]EGO00531.1 hypothetical protein SERLA73DRAFT_71551 [Serpula lacrymans var. lacrymans S7.3]EGO26091.1 hypothetical protein SERLADRAFT_435936 [Serpula lacrymans var. lacrymans S7.9]